MQNYMVGKSVFLGFPYMVSISHLNVNTPDSKVHGANMGPIWGRQDPGGPHVGPMNFPFWAMDTALCQELLLWCHDNMAIIDSQNTHGPEQDTAITVCQSINYLYDFKVIFLWSNVYIYIYMGQVTKLWLSCYLVLLSIDSKTREQDSNSFVNWPIYIYTYIHIYIYNWMQL